MRHKIIVVDNNTDGVMCECATYSIAHSVSCGFINSSVKVLPSNIPSQVQEFDKNFNSNQHHYQHRAAKIYDMTPSLITEQWIALKELAMLRNGWQAIWETRCNQYLLNRNREYAHLEQFEGFLWRELDACKPDENFYTQAIVEWATLSDVSVSTAYQELKLKAESRGLQYLRNHAIHQKYVFLLNQENTKEGLLEVLLDGLTQIINRALI